MILYIQAINYPFLLYADDTTLYFNLEDFAYQDREFHINNELEKVNIWLKLNKLTLNSDKTKCMYFHKHTFFFFGA